MNFGSMMKQAQKMQTQMAKMQEELAETTLEASAGGGAVKVTVSGSKELRAIAIDPAAIDPDDVEMLQDTIVAAVNEALRSADELASQRMQSITGGLNIPGLI